MKTKNYKSATEKDSASTKILENRLRTMCPLKMIADDG
jgi:hypothetical protein